MSTELNGIPNRRVWTNTAECLDPVEILQDLVALPSVNPMGKDPVAATDFEHRMTDWLVDFFQQLDVPYEIHEVASGRCNVVARYDSPGATQTIMLDAHQDTVPVDGMTIPPFKPEIRNGRLYGRGACDVKGGMAAMLAAFARLVQERPYGAANVIMACTCDEEFTALGAAHLADNWGKQDASESLTATPPDVCIVAEPTELNAIVAHRGVVRWKLKTNGVACHSSRPHEGVNAIYGMSQILQVIQEYIKELPQFTPYHELCGGATLSVGRIYGGTSVNIVPHECIIEIDRRLVPGEDPKQVIPHLEAYLRERVDVNFEMLPSWIEAGALSDADNGPWSDKLLSQVEAVSGPHEKQGAWYCTNAAAFSAAGVPSIVFGPGSIAQAHTADEWIEVAQLRQACEIYYRLCAE